MAAISRHQFYERIGPNFKCQNFYHKWTNSCILGNLGLFPVYLKGVIIFYLPLYLAKILVEYKKVDKKYLKHAAKAYVKSVLYGCGIAAYILSTICILCNISGRLHYYFVGAVPGFISGLALLMESKQNQKLNSLIWLAMAVETIIYNAQYYKIIKITKLSQTLLFMCTSSLLMALLANSNRKQIPTNIWIYQPHRKSEAKSGYCNHGKNNSDVKCLNYCWNKFIKYFGIGFALNSVRSVISNFTKITKHPRLLIKLILNEKNVRFAAFIGGYVGIYQTISCKLNGSDTFLSSALAGFLAGSTYYFKPTMNILAIAIVTLIQVSFYRKEEIRNLTKKIPKIEVFFYMLSNMLLFHNRIAHPQTCAKYYINMLHIASSGLLTTIYADLIRHFFN